MIPDRRRIGYLPRTGQDQEYRADILVTDFLWAENDSNGHSCNLAFDRMFLEPSRQILAYSFESETIYPVPVAYDAVASIAALQAGESSETLDAFMPAMTNLQQVNGHLLVPRPFGPRMKIADAIDTVREAMADVRMPAPVRARVTRSLVSAYSLHRPYRRWIEKIDPVHLTSGGPSGTILTSFRGLYNEDDLADTFRDFFSGKSIDEVRTHLKRRNPQAFRGRRMDYGFHRLALDDGLVDLFELWFAAIAAELGIPQRQLHFVDSWFYHLRSGQVHCGTNVLRRPSALRRDWWDVPDASSFRGSSVNMEEENVTVPAR